VDSHDEKVALGASLALLERGYGKPVSDSEVEERIRSEATAAEERKREAATEARLKAARENLLKQWDSMSPARRRASLAGLSG